MIAARLSPGAISESSSSHLPPSEAAEIVQEVPDLLGFPVARGIAVASWYTTLRPYPRPAMLAAMMRRLERATD
jgi:hypothetical protein